MELRCSNYKRLGYRTQDHQGYCIFQPFVHAAYLSSIQRVGWLKNGEKLSGSAEIELTLADVQQQLQTTSRCFT